MTELGARITKIAIAANMVTPMTFRFIEECFGMVIRGFELKTPNAEDERRRLTRFSSPRRRPLYPMLGGRLVPSLFEPVINPSTNPDDKFEADAHQEPCDGVKQEWRNEPTNHCDCNPESSINSSPRS